MDNGGRDGVTFCDYGISTEGSSIASLQDDFSNFLAGDLVLLEARMELPLLRLHNKLQSVMHRLNIYNPYLYTIFEHFIVYKLVLKDR